MEQWPGPAPLEGFNQGHPNSLNTQMAPLHQFNAYLPNGKLHLLSTIFAPNFPLIQNPNGTIDLFASIRKLDQIVHPLVEVAEDGTWIFLQNAFIIRPNIIITSRHGVDAKILGNLRFLLPTTHPERSPFHRLSLIEDGDEFNVDYVLFQVEPEGNQPPLVPFFPISLDSPLPKEEVLTVSCYVTPQNIYKGAIMGLAGTPTSAYAFNVLVRLFTEPGFCGAPFLTAKNEIVGFHLRAAKQVMFQGEREGFFFGEAPEHSILYSLIRNFPVDYREALISEPDFEFDDLFVPDFFYEEEDRTKRLFIFGKTPTKTSGTGTEILKRWELNGNAQYSGIVAGPKKYKDIDNWKIFLKIKGQPTQWVKLSHTQPSKKDVTKEVTAIHMGHKLSCNEYWNKGSKAYLTQRIQAVQNSKKSKYDTQPKKDTKISELKKRYKPYKDALKGKYNTLFMSKDPDAKKEYSELKRQFMKDHRNYRFEWGSDNSSDGAKMPDYDETTNFKWSNTPKGPALIKK